MSVDLIEIVRQRRGERSQEEYAKDLGIGQSTLSMLLAGKIPLGPRVAKRVRALYPDLTFALAEHVLGSQGEDSAA